MRQFFYYLPKCMLLLGLTPFGLGWLWTQSPWAGDALVVTAASVAYLGVVPLLAAAMTSWWASKEPPYVFELQFFLTLKNHSYAEVERDLRDCLRFALGCVLLVGIVCMSSLQLPLTAALMIPAGLFSAWWVLRPGRAFLARLQDVFVPWYERFNRGEGRDLSRKASSFLYDDERKLDDELAAPLRAAYEARVEAAKAFNAAGAKIYQSMGDHRLVGLRVSRDITSRLKLALEEAWQDYADTVVDLQAALGHVEATTRAHSGQAGPKIESQWVTGQESPLNRRSKATVVDS